MTWHNKLILLLGLLCSTLQSHAVIEPTDPALIKQYQLNQKQLSDFTPVVQAHERRVADMETKLRTLEVQYRKQTTLLDDQRRTLCSLVGAAQRYARRTPDVAAIVQNTTTEVIRGSMLMRSTVGKLKENCLDLRKSVSEIRILKNTLETEHQALLKQRESLALKLQELKGLIHHQQDILKRQEQKRNRIETRINRLAKEAVTIRELVRRLELEKTVKPIISVVPKMKIKGKVQPLSLPIPTNFTKSFNKNSDDVFAQGLIFQANPGMTVASPASGIIVFAGPFRSYGQLLILQHDGGYHSLLIGLSEINCIVGQAVLAGEPLGVVSDKEQGRLYWELRCNGDPIDPTPWLVQKPTIKAKKND